MKHSAYILIVLCAAFSGCHKTTGPLVITTAAVSDIWPVKATCGGDVYFEGKNKVSEKGICWSTSPNPTTDNSKLSSGEGTGSFSAEMNSLQPGTVYYVRAYAVSGSDIVYGDQLKFITLAPHPFPSITNNGAFAISTNSCMCTYNIDAVNSDGILETGICWSTGTQPTTSDNKIANTSGSLSFTNSLAGLNPNTVYYTRAYVTNNSGTMYSSAVAFKTYAGTVSDADGNIYYTVIIGGKEWMAENLRVTKYRDGTPIPDISDSNAWSTANAGACCSYNNDPSLVAANGKLYNWSAVTDAKNLAPTGWHIPADDEWSQLQASLGGSDIAAQDMKLNSQWPGGGSNSSGFSAVPSGGRGNTGLFGGLGFSTAFWSATSVNSAEASLKIITFNNVSLNNTEGEKIAGYSVRCVKD